MYAPIGYPQYQLPQTVPSLNHPYYPSPKQTHQQSNATNFQAMSGINPVSSTMSNNNRVNAGQTTHNANSSMIISTNTNNTNNQHINYNNLPIITLPHPHIIASTQGSAVSQPLIQFSNSNDNLSNSNSLSNKNSNNNNSNNSKHFGLNNIPRFDIQPPKQLINSGSPRQAYCDTSSNTSQPSNATSMSITSMNTITSLSTMLPPPPPPASMAIKTEAIKKDKDKDRNKKIKMFEDVFEEEITSKNGQWIIREHINSSARTEGYYSLAPRNKKKKFRHLARKGGREDGTARNIRINKRRLENCLKQTHGQTVFKMNSLQFRQKNIQFGKSSIHSWGVFALEDIAAEEMVVEYIGEYINEKYANLREKLYRKQGYDDYMFRVDDNLIIDATKRGNLARFINHSCDPNCYTRIIHVNNTPRVVIYSKRFIKEGEELTYDYKFPIEDDKIQCLCGSKNCRGTLN